MSLYWIKRVTRHIYLLGNQPSTWMLQFKFIVCNHKPCIRSQDVCFMLEVHGFNSMPRAQSVVHKTYDWPVMWLHKNIYYLCNTRHSNQQLIILWLSLEAISLIITRKQIHLIFNNLNVIRELISPRHELNFNSDVHPFWKAWWMK